MAREGKDNNIFIVDEVRERFWGLIALRLPWLVFGLAVGVGVSFLVSRFEEILSQNIGLVFFIPIVVYMSDAVGSQSETLFVRRLAFKSFSFFKYLFKEILIGLVLGLILGALTGLAAFYWLGSIKIALTVAISMAVTVTISPLIALLMSEFLFKEHADPALGAGPVFTAFQDFISLAVYFLVASAIILGGFWL